MLRTILSIPSICLLGLVAVSCSAGATKGAVTHTAVPVQTRSADDAVKGSGWLFGQATSVRITFVVRSAGLDGTVEGDAEYRLGRVVYAQTNVFSGQLKSSDTAGLLFLPPDLYLKRGDGSWFVQCPWNQGIRPGQEQGLGIGLDQPIIDYTSVSQHVRGAAQRGSETLNGVAAARYHGTIAESDLAPPAPGQDPNLTADIDLWLQADSGLPLKVVFGSGGVNAYSVTVEFSDYGKEAAAPKPPNGARPLRDATFPDAPCIGNQLAGCLAAQAGIHGADACTGRTRRLCLAPLGQVPPALVDSLVAYYKQEYGLDVIVLKPAAIPASLEDPLRQQIDADGLITYMAGLFPSTSHDPEAVVIGLTVVDLYDATSHFRYVFGLRRGIADPKAVVSTLRMDPRFYSEPPDTGLVTTRVRKLLSKYVGLLMWGLPPSSEPTSPMYDSILGTDDVDRMTEPLPVPWAR
ncbi:MAG TPA: hypothetical protein VEZ14_04845 [Dehalococcoidia bacterium]|nr:hypothetical protein [Dehalococcoidia bacterium]